MGRKKRGKSKAAAGSVAFDIMTADYSQLERRIADQLRNKSKRTARARAHAMFSAPYGTFMRTAEEQLMTDDERYWNAAFQQVLGVGPYFYARADIARRRYLEAHYRELATRDTPKGRKAAKVVASYVQCSLARGRPTISADLAYEQIDAYRYMFGRRTPSVIRGKQAGTIIIDDTVKP